MGQGRETGTLDHHHADLGDVRLHYVTAGSGFPVVLLHGWPQSWYEWRLIMPGLAERFRVIAPDLRGLGDSSRPAGGYDKKTVGGDIWRLANEILGISEFHLVGHDWGGPTAYAVAAAHPEAVRKLAILDVTIPGDGSPNISQGGPAVAPCVSPDARLARGSGNRPRGYLPRLVLPHLRRSAGCHSGCRYRGVFAGVSAAGCVAGRVFVLSGDSRGYRRQCRNRRAIQTAHAGSGAGWRPVVGAGVRGRRVAATACSGRQRWRR